MSEDERQRQMDFIITQQAQFSVNIDLLRLNIDDLRGNIDDLRGNIDDLRGNVDALREAQARTDATVFQLAQQVSQIATQQTHINEVVAVIADAQQHTDERLSALIDIVREGRNGKS